MAGLVLGLYACKATQPTDGVKDVIKDIITIQQAGLEYVHHFNGIPETLYKLSGTGYLDTSQLSYAWGDYVIYQEQDQMYIGAYITDQEQFEILKHYLPRVYTVESANLVITPLFAIPLEDLLNDMGSSSSASNIHSSDPSPLGQPSTENIEKEPSSSQQDRTKNGLGGSSNLSGLL